MEAHKEGVLAITLLERGGGFTQAQVQVPM